jgi:hypothetical protein
MPAEEWLARRDHQRSSRHSQILGYQDPIRHVPPTTRTRTNRPIEYRYPRPPAAEAVSPWPEVRTRIDKALRLIRQEPRAKHARHRAVLLRHHTLAREVYQLIQQRGVNDALDNLDLSRQALRDVWERHGWPPPIGVGNCTRRRP